MPVELLYPDQQPGTQFLLEVICNTTAGWIQSMTTGLISILTSFLFPHTSQKSIASMAPAKSLGLMLPKDGEN